jgi:hypothetical protein
MALVRYWDQTSNTYKAVTIQGSAGLAGPVGPPGPQQAPASTGLWVPSIPTMAALSAGLTWVANNIRITRIKVEQAIDRAQISCTGTAAGNLQIGVWTDTNSAPGTLVVQSALVASTSGNIITPLALSPGYYWIGLTCSAAAVFLMSSGANPLLPGFDAATTASTMASLPSALLQTAVPPGTLPSPFPMTGIVRNTQAPAISLRVA